VNYIVLEPYCNTRLTWETDPVRDYYNNIELIKTENPPFFDLIITDDNELNDYYWKS